MSNHWLMSCMAPWRGDGFHPRNLIPPFWEVGLHEDQGRPADEVFRYYDPIGSAPSLLPATRSLQPSSYGQSDVSLRQPFSRVQSLRRSTGSHDMFVVWRCGSEHLYHMLFKIKQVSEDVRLCESSYGQFLGGTVGAHNPAHCSGRLWRYFEEHANNVESPTCEESFQNRKLRSKGDVSFDLIVIIIRITP